MLTDDQISDTLISCFVPLKCDVQFFDYGTKLRFRVRDNTESTLVEFPNLVVRKVRVPSCLRTIVSETRERLARRGCTLEPFSSPILAMSQ